MEQEQKTKKDFVDQGATKTREMWLNSNDKKKKKSKT